MAPVILKTFVHCRSCAGRIRKAINKYSGVDEVLVSVDTGLILVTGRNLDASFLKWRIQSKIKKCRVDVISDGTVEEPPLGYPPYPYPYYYNSGTMAPQLAGPPAYSCQPPPAAAYPYGGGAALGTWVPGPPPPHLLQYVPPELLYARQQYMTNEAPLWFNDDNPNGCCSVQ